MAAAQGQMSLQQLQAVNLQARGLINANALQMTQQIFSGSFTPSSQNIVNIAPRNVGLIQGFIVEVNGNIINNGSTTAAALTGFGLQNAITNFQFTDLNNYVRHNTSGRHVANLNSVRSGAAYGGAYSPAYPATLGNNWTVQSAPSSIAAGANSNVRMIYYVPVSYSDADLRGAIYASVVQATMNLQMTINPNPVIASGDPLAAIYTGNTGAWNGAVTITVYQHYLDQLPQGQNGPILPPLDLNNFYELKETNLTGMTANTDFPYGYADFRQFQSTMATFDNNGVFNVGSDVNYFSLISANLTQIWKITPEIAALWARQATLQDMPPGCYWFDSRGNAQIQTVNFGNIQLNLNAHTVNAPASLFVATEAFGQYSQVANASSLSAG